MLQPFLKCRICSHLELVDIMVNNNNYLANLGYDDEYDGLSLLYTNSVILRDDSSNNLYCYSEDKESDILNVCSAKT